MISREEFYAECEKLKRYKSVKHFTLKKKIELIFRIVFSEIVLFFVCYMIPVKYLYMSNLDGIILYIIFSAIIIGGFLYETKNDLVPKNVGIKLRYSREVIKILLKGYKYTYSQFDHIEESIFIHSPLWKSYSKFKGADLLTIDIPNDDGSPSGVVFSVCDIDTTNNQENNNFYSSGFYKGAFGCIKFPFNFKCNLGLSCSISGLKKIELEDIEFNEKFCVYTDNQVEALTILTPDLMRKLVDFNDKYTGFKLFIKENGELYFGMDRNLFEINIPKKGKPFHYMFDRFYDDVKAILEIVEEIKNNNKIFKM